MASPSSMQKQYAKDMFAKMAEGSLGRDEGAELQQAQQQAANQALQAQQKQLHRQAMSYGQGDPVAAGASKQAAQELAETAADSAIKASGAAKDYQQKVFESQQKAAMQMMDTAVSAELAKKEQNKELVGGILEVAGPLIGMALCWVAVELWGEDSLITKYARLWANTHDNWFTRRYLRDGRAWAQRLKRKRWLRPAAKLIWGTMALAGYLQFTSELNRALRS